MLLCRFRDILTTSRVVRRCELVEEDFNFGFEPPFDGECPSHDGRGRPPVPSSGNPASSVLEPGGPGPLRSPGWDVEKTWGRTSGEAETPEASGATPRRRPTAALPVVSWAIQGRLCILL